MIREGDVYIIKCCQGGHYAKMKILNVSSPYADSDEINAKEQMGYIVNVKPEKGLQLTGGTVRIGLLNPFDGHSFPIGSDGCGRSGPIAQYDKQIEAYKQAIRIEPNHVLTWRNLGQSYYNTRAFKDAIDAFKHAIDIEPKHATTRFKLGRVYFMQGDKESAL